MIDIRPNLAEAVAFAFSLPTDQAQLCAIHPTGNRPVVGRSFPKTEAGQAAALRWLENADRMGYGIYFNANEVKPLGKGHAKAKEAEVSTVRFLHADADRRLRRRAPRKHCWVVSASPSLPPIGPAARA